MYIIRTAAAAAIIAGCTILAGCASDPDGGSYVANSSSARQQTCPPGETLMCESRSPNRISDGRYGYKSRNMQGRCSCQPDKYLEAMEGKSLPGDKL